MANKKIVKIVLDGKERHLYYNLNSLEIIEDITGKPLEEALQGINMKMIKALAYAGLKWEDKKLTLEAVGDMIGFADIEPLSNAIGECFEGLK